jgi:hypothetical protein
MFTAITLLVTGAWLVLQSFLMNTKNFRSSLYFKIVPFTLGMLCIYNGAKLFGWI